ncbi:protein FAM166B isoform X3 [Chionomys nivalis]|uniref:protein FAM166B isoform X3 n=1 Tax=Chionomys nivalis TaxID=269649 RepID=UPI0025951788|nr:protein FAM166B isoform X3 [Chionomys nivalis]
MAVVNTDIPGLSPRNPHYIPGYTGHCPLLRYSMGQTYGQVTGQLLRGPPGLAWPPAHRKLLPPIQSPRSPGISRGKLPPRRGHERLSSSIVPGYTGFIPQAQFMFAKNCNQVWAEAMNNFTQRHGQQESHERSKEARGGKEAEKDQGPKAEEPELQQEVAQVSWGRRPPTPWMTQIPRNSSCQALQEFGQKCSKGRVQKDPKPLSPLPRPNFQNLGLLPHYSGYVPGYKFQFGGTFGHLTHDALGLSTTQKQLLA